MPFHTLIDTGTLTARLSDPTFVIIDCRYSLDDQQWGRREYEKQHIPGASFASIDDDLSGPKTGRNGRHPLPDPHVLTRTLGRLGITNLSQVVAYDQDAGMYASRLWWLLRWLGHERVAVLDGGFAKWASEGRPLRSREETCTPREFTGSPRPGLAMDVSEVTAAAASTSWVLVDARAPERFRGEVEPIDRTPGHIPGAVNYFYKWNIGASGAFRSPEEIRQQAHRVLGGRPPDRAIFYCGSGVTACQDLLALEHAGLKGARLYPGSWSEWSSDPARPVERSSPVDPSRAKA
jgi:thiosulfate/3-mercaptopyruvate sulfurtransferase